uniref:Uncharacterized protein n=1 Tax=Rhizophora mucronata TaxID=61149 RepID=A0A2P2P0C9_RHIMU
MDSFDSVFSVRSNWIAVFATKPAPFSRCSVFFVFQVLFLLLCFIFLGSQYLKAFAFELFKTLSVL